VHRRRVLLGRCWCRHFEHCLIAIEWRRTWSKSCALAQLGQEFIHASYYNFEACAKVLIFAFLYSLPALKKQLLTVWRKSLIFNNSCLFFKTKTKKIFSTEIFLFNIFLFLVETESDGRLQETSATWWLARNQDQIVLAEQLQNYFWSGRRRELAVRASWRS